MFFYSAKYTELEQKKKPDVLQDYKTKCVKTADSINIKLYLYKYIY